MRHRLADLDRDRFTDAVLGLIEHAGQTRYDASVTQLEHACQTAALAERDGASPPLVAAALLHDIGHLLVDEHDGQEDFLTADLRHEALGARVLGRHLGPAVAGPVALHVAAKRYLVTVDPAYRAGLSEASTASLRLQGGPMNGDELLAFRARPHAAAAVQLRRWDDAAKDPEAITPGPSHWEPLLRRLTTEPPA
jgi:phosphonate degradation associated HDIG domain protein